MRISIITLILYFSLFITACDNKDVTQHYLEISTKSEINAPAEETDIVVSIKTNFDSWNAKSDNDWLEPIKYDNTLILRLKENKGISARKAKVEITTKDDKKEIIVHQEATKEDKEINKKEVIIEPKGGVQTIPIGTSTTEWSVYSNDKWVKTKKNNNQDISELILTVEENTSEEDRVADINVEVEGSDMIIKVVQKGKNKFLMPFLLWGKDYEDIHQKEISRGSQLVLQPKRPKERYDGNLFYTYYIDNNLFSNISYMFDDYGTEHLSAVVITTKNKSVISLPSFEKFIKDNKFEELNRTIKVNGISRTNFYNKELNTYLIITDNEYTQNHTLEFIPKPKQTDKQASINKLNDSTFELEKDKSEKITEYENENGGLFSKDLSTAMDAYSPNKIHIYFAPNPYTVRVYATDRVTDVIKHHIHIYQDISLGLYKYGNIYAVNSKLEEMLIEGGFVFYEYDIDTNTYWYISNKKKMKIEIAPAIWNQRLTLKIKYSVF